MTLYEVLRFFHILAAITWVGGNLTVNILGSKMQRAGGAEAGAAFMRQVEWVGTRVFVPSILLVLGLGIAMVAESEAWTIGQLWVVLALVGLGISVVAGAGFFGPETGRISAAMEARGDDPEVQRRISRLLFLGRLELILLALIVADMVFKPGL